MMKKIFITSLFLVIIVIIAVVWVMKQQISKNSSPYTASGGQSHSVLKIESEYWPGSYWIEVAYKKGWFTEAGLEVQLIDATNDYNQALQDMVDGKMDENNFTLFDLMKFNAKGADLVSVVNTDISSGTEAIIAPTVFKSVSDLKGKRIGTAKGTYLEYILDQVLKRNNMTINDITLVDIVPEKAQDELNKHTVDAVLTYEPTVGQVLEQKQYHKLFDTSEMLGVVPSVVAFHKTFIDQHPEIVQKFVNVWSKTTQYMLQNPQETNQIIASYYSSSQNATSKEAESFTHIDKILDLPGNRVAFSYSTGLDSLYGTASFINNYLIDRHLLQTELNTTAFIDSRFIRAL